MKMQICHALVVDFRELVRHQVGVIITVLENQAIVYENHTKSLILQLSEQSELATFMEFIIRIHTQV